MVSLGLKFCCMFNTEVHLDTCLTSIIQNDSLNNKANQLFFQYSLTKCWKTSPGLKIPFHTDEAGNMFQYHGMNTSVPLAS